MCDGPEQQQLETSTGRSQGRGFEGFARIPEAAARLSKSVVLCCFVVLRHARLWISYAHPASVVVENQLVAVAKTLLSTEPRDLPRFVELVMQEFQRLNEFNIARYRLPLSEYWAWYRAFQSAESRPRESRSRVCRRR